MQQQARWPAPPQGVISAHHELEQPPQLGWLLPPQPTTSLVFPVQPGSVRQFRPSPKQQQARSPA